MGTAPAATEMSERIAAVVDAGLPFLVAEVAGHVAGFAYAGPYRTRPAYRHTVEDSVYLDPDAVGCGFAHVGTLRSVGWKHGRWLDTVLMQRALGDGDERPAQ